MSTRRAASTMSYGTHRALLRLALRIQALYYVVTGAWPLVSIGTFERVTGPKVDEWLVYMVGLLAIAIGSVLWVGARASRPDTAIVLLGLLTAISFAAIDVRFALAGRISSIYFLDALAEVVLLLPVAAGWLRVRHTTSDENETFDDEIPRPRDC